MSPPPILPPELHPLILSFCSDSALATCLRVSSTFYHLAGSLLYHALTFSPSTTSPTTPFAGGDLKTPLLAYTRHLTLLSHTSQDHSLDLICPPAPILLPNLETLTLALDPWSDHALCHPPWAAPCPLLASLRPRTLILDSLHALTSSLPSGLHPSCEIFDYVERVVIRPTTYVTRFPTKSEWYVPACGWVQLPAQVAEVVVSFEGKGEWPRVNGRWPNVNGVKGWEFLPGRTTLRAFVEDLVEVVCRGEDVARETADRAEGRRWRAVGAGKVSKWLVADEPPQSRTKGGMEGEGQEVKVDRQKRIEQVFWDEMLRCGGSRVDAVDVSFEVSGSDEGW